MRITESCAGLSVRQAGAYNTGQRLSVGNQEHYRQQERE